MAKKKLGDKQYYFGYQITLPQTDPSQESVPVYTFKGRFDRRKLRRMVKQTICPSWTTDEADYIIDTFGVRLRPVSMDELIKTAQADA